MLELFSTLDKLLNASDRKTVTIEIADFKPVMQQTIRWNLKAADGTPVAQEVMHTIHALP